MTSPEKSTRTAIDTSLFLVRREGSAAIEFALIAPLLLVFLVGALCYGIYFGAANSVQQIAADVARATVAGLTEEERGVIAQRYAADVAKSFVLIDPARIAVKTAPSAANSDILEVTVSYDASRLAIWAFAGLIPMPSRVIVRSAAIRRGGY